MTGGGTSCGVIGSGFCGPVGPDEGFAPAVKTNGIESTKQTIGKSNFLIRINLQFTVLQK